MLLLLLPFLESLHCPGVSKSEPVNLAIAITAKARAVSLAVAAFWGIGIGNFYNKIIILFKRKNRFFSLFNLLLILSENVAVILHDFRSDARVLCV